MAAAAAAAAAGRAPSGICRLLSHVGRSCSLDYPHPACGWSPSVMPSPLSPLPPFQSTRPPFDITQHHPRVSATTALTSATPRQPCGATHAHALRLQRDAGMRAYPTGPGGAWGAARAESEPRRRLAEAYRLDNRLVLIVALPVASRASSWRPGPRRRGPGPERPPQCMHVPL